jgi:hypothetical protein
VSCVDLAGALEKCVDECNSTFCATHGGCLDKKDSAKGGWALTEQDEKKDYSSGVRVVAYTRLLSADLQAAQITTATVPPLPRLGVHFIQPDSALEELLSRAIFSVKFLLFLYTHYYL